LPLNLSEFGQTIVTASQNQRSATLSFFGVIAITDQTNHKKDIESVALQRFQYLSWFGFERKA
jgi:hypothetical protein